MADLNQARCFADCTVFEGKLVVAGGCSRSNKRQLESVEAYDYHVNKWFFLPNMFEERHFML